MNQNHNHKETQMRRLADNTRNPARRPELRSSFWPPPETFAQPTIAEAVAEVRSLADRATDAHQNAVEAGHAVERAKMEDVAAHALAIRDGKSRPKPKASAAEAAREKAEQEAAALTAAVDTAAADAVAALDEHGGELAEQLRRSRQEQIATLVAALDDVARRQGELEETGAVLAYLRADEIRPWRGAVGRSLPRPSLPRTSDEPSFGKLVEALRATAEGMQDEVERPDVRPLRQMAGAA